MRAIELFAGIGGLKLAAPAGVEVVVAYDQDRAAGLAHGENHAVPVHDIVHVIQLSVAPVKIGWHRVGWWKQNSTNYLCRSSLKIS